MSKNVGTLIGAPIRPSDSNDSYAVAYQSEIKGGHHSKSSVAAMEAIPAHLREPGMTCHVTGNGNTYELGNDLITWALKSSSTANGGGTTGPGTGGNSSTTAIISGNFGEWTDLPNKSASIYDEQLSIKYKADITAFATRAIVYLSGQFALNAAFTGTEITLGTLPVGARPTVNLKKYFIAQNIEMFLVITTGGDVKLLSKDGFNLPTTPALGAGEHEEEPYYIDIFFHPEIAPVVPLTYTATRSEDFFRSNCGPDEAGSLVVYEKEYTSTISQEDADNQAANDPDFMLDGQAYANANGTCELIVTDPVTYAAELIITNWTGLTPSLEVWDETDDTALYIGSVMSGGNGPYTINPLDDNGTIKLIFSSAAGIDTATVTVNGVVYLPLVQGSTYTYSGIPKNNFSIFINP